MRWFTAVEVVLLVFWVSYGILAAYVLYEATPPVSRVLLLAIGGYATMLAPVLAIVVWRARRAGSRSSRAA